MSPRRSARLQKRARPSAKGKENAPPSSPQSPKATSASYKSDIFSNLDDLSSVKLPVEDISADKTVEKESAKELDEDFSEIQPDFTKLAATRPKETQHKETDVAKDNEHEATQRKNSDTTEQIIPRVPLKALQNVERDLQPTTPRKQRTVRTYAKRRIREAAIPSMRELGVIKTPNEREDKQSESEQSESESERTDEELKTFFKRQRELWDEVDQVELEEEALD